jgi:pyruvate formate-lyase activating enzyme-like uncharacterized protein
MELAPEKMVVANQAEFKEEYSLMRFVTPAEADEAATRRDRLLTELSGRVKAICRETKLHTGDLSPGCGTCCEGDWSCLFINGVCNGRCFYCPTSQNSKGEPTTNSLKFANPRDYLDYVAHYRFKGVSLSGGEPLMTFDRTMTYVSKLKQRFGDEIHLWLYTNGTLATAEKIVLLRDAGLNEIRFDISADHYSLDKLKLAIGKIPCVTVEIPAIPEDYRKLRELLPELAGAGVNHLNLHQLRCTPHNLSHLLPRHYTFSHGPKVVIPESELTALQLLLDADQNGGPSVNYCSYAYKYRFQTRAARRRAAEILTAPYEDVTEAGFIRSLQAKGSEEQLGHCLERLRGAGVDAALYRVDKGGGRLSFSGILWPLLDFSGLALQVRYFQAQLQENVSGRGSSLKVQLNRKRSLIAERRLIETGRTVSADQLQLFHTLFISGKNDFPLLTAGEKIAEPFRDIFEYELILQGLQRYC